MAEALTGTRVLRVTAEPASRQAWLRDVWDHRQVMVALARKDFTTRYKRAGFGLLWSIALPLLQGTVLAIIFSRVSKFGTSGDSYTAFVLSGIIAWSFFSTSVLSGSTAITDGASLADKVWFPRAILVTAPVGANAIGFTTSLVALLVAGPFVGAEYSERLVLLVPGVLLLFGLTLGLALCLAALHVYFRDTKFLVQAAVLVLIYLSPVILDPRQLIPEAAGWFDFNPLTGILSLFHVGYGSADAPLLRPVLVSVLTVVVLCTIALEAHRRHDRRFVDLL
jgi:ABC-type polysaccharide/polyol phosphate export permease